MMVCVRSSPSQIPNIADTLSSPSYVPQVSPGFVSLQAFRVSGGFPKVFTVQTTYEFGGHKHQHISGPTSLAE